MNLNHDNVLLNYIDIRQISTIIISALFLLGCVDGKKDYISDEDIDIIAFAIIGSAGPDLESPVPWTSVWTVASLDGFRDTLITDRSSLDSLDAFLKALEPIDDNLDINCDIKTSILVYRNDGRRQEIGADYNQLVSVDGKTMKGVSSFYGYINRIIYRHEPSYWLPAWMKEPEVSLLLGEKCEEMDL